MPIRSMLLSAVALMAAHPAAAAARQTPVVLACNIPSRPVAGAPAPAGDRIFQLAPGELREWDPVRKRFGINLCAAFRCVRSADRIEGSISSASVVYTVGFAGGLGYWRVMGASGGGPRSGSCRTVSPPRP